MDRAGLPVSAPAMQPAAILHRSDVMWCEHCQQDVPGVATVDENDLAEICCARCGVVMAHKPLPSGGGAHTLGVSDVGIDLAAAEANRPPNPQTDSPLPAGAPTAFDSPPELDDWLLESELQRLTQPLDKARGNASRQRPSVDRGQPGRIDAAHPHLGGWHPADRPSRRSSPGGAPTSAAHARRPMSLLAWTMLAVGMATFVCGAVLLGWSLMDGYAHLWNLGMPITLAGQLGMLVGLVLQLERLWQTNHHTTEKLNAVDGRLDDLRQTTQMLSTTHGSASHAFYAHLSEGASPQLLLTDLKSQLDLLAQRMSPPLG